ncbi:hypothetical protein [Burkholderia gladioli]|uniref:hypothetical protein n=1 Tax=Burkholderia gladioli TaxID=28095 RepID=UPI00163EAEEC|nr:hypothetical protein [Burkholderia gladioli]
MNLQSLARGLLRLRLALARFGTGPLAAGAALVCAALLWLGVLPGMAARVEDETRSAARLATLPPPKPVISAPELAADRLAGFYRGLGDSAHTGEIVTRLFEAAAAAGVTLDKAEYKPGHDTPGRFDTYTIVLPVKGDYAKLRLFSEKVLLAVPYAALDDMRFKRGSANDAGVEANLRFTAFLRPVTIAPLSASEVAAIEAAGAASGASATAVAGAPASGVAAASAVSASGAAVAAKSAAAMPQAASTIDTTRRALASSDGFVPLPTSGVVSPHPLTVVPVNAQAHGEATAAKPVSVVTSVPKSPVTLPALATAKPAAAAPAATATRAARQPGERGAAASPAVPAVHAAVARDTKPVAPSTAVRAAPAPGAAGIAMPVPVAAPARGAVAKRAATTPLAASAPGVIAKPENAKAAGSAIPQATEAKATLGGSARMAALAAESAAPHADQAKATLGGSARMAALAAESAAPHADQAKATLGGSARMAALAAESTAPHADQAKATLGGSARMAALAAATASAPSPHSQEAKPASAVAARPAAVSASSPTRAIEAPSRPTDTTPAASAIPASAAAPVHVIDLSAQPGGSTRRFTEIAIVSPAGAPPASAGAAPLEGGAP